MKRALMTVAMMALAACAIVPHRSQQSAPVSAPASTAAVAPQEMSAHGTAGWVGQEFAGRTTANGEIFDPMLMTAAHRTLPFGTLLDVRNPKTGQTARVRVNDRGPYVGDRLIDLSYAAAQQIGLADGGGGEVDISVAKVGRGDREPPTAFAVNVPDNSSVAAVPPAATPAPAPAPVPATVESQPAPVPATVESVQVTEQHASAPETRKEVAADGTTIVEVPVTSTPLPAPVQAPAPVTPTKRTTPAAANPGPATPRPQPAASRTGRYLVQVGAFSQEANAKALQKKLKAIGQDAMIEHTSLYLVRIGPFETRDQAVSVRAKLEAAGISAIITAQ
jgi:rare lipoprotein A